MGNRSKGSRARQIKKTDPGASNQLEKTNQLASKLAHKEARVDAVREVHVGPLPAPETLAQYDQVLNGAAERIIAMAENQAAHRQELEASHLRSEQGRAKTGLWFALLVGLAGIIGSSVCIYHGQATGGSILGGSTLAALVGSFIYGSQKKAGPDE